MAQAKTLMEMAGVTPAAPDPAETALVLIDCQREYVDGVLPLPGVEVALAEAGRVLAYARDKAMPVIHIQHRGREGALFDPATPRFEIHPVVAPAAGEPVIEKGLPNAFAGTDLQAKLEDTGRRQALFIGFMTHMCVSSTARAALDLGFAGTVVAAACATRDLPDGAGGVVAAADLHRAELAALSDRFATILPDAKALRP